MKIKTTKDLLESPESDLIVNYIMSRYNKGLYTLVLTAGLPGTGKSSVGQRLKQLLHEQMGGESKVEHIVDNLLDLVKFVKNASPDKEEPDICVVEEISVLFPSRRAMSGDNVDIARILDTCRKKKVILIANAPLWNSVDSHIRAMANVFLQTIRIYRDVEIVYCKCYKLQTNPQSGKTYTHSFKRDNKDVSRCYFRKPNKELWEQYENRKDSFLDMIYSRIEARQVKKMKEDKKLLQHLNPQVVQGLTKRELEVYDKVYNKGMQQKEIAVEWGVDPAIVCRLMKKIKEKMTNPLENEVN